MDRASSFYAYIAPRTRGTGLMAEEADFLHAMCSSATGKCAVLGY